MQFRSFTPAPPLDAYIERFWLCSDAPVHSRERILPSGTLELVINLLDNEIRILDPEHGIDCRRFSGTVVSGAYSRYFNIDPSVHGLMLGVHFRPGGAFPFLGIPIGELADQHVDLRTLWGPLADTLYERLREAASAEARVSLLQEALLGRLGAARGRHPAVTRALHLLERGDPSLRVGDLAESVGLCQRRLIQAFTAEVGVTPKRYQRICRFQQAQRQAGSGLVTDWTEIALDYGYFDQSHMIRDFQEFAGCTPTDFLLRCTEPLLLNHIR